MDFYVILDLDSEFTSGVFTTPVKINVRMCSHTSFSQSHIQTKNSSQYDEMEELGKELKLPLVKYFVLGCCQSTKQSVYEWVNFQKYEVLFD